MGCGVARFGRRGQNHLNLHFCLKICRQGFQGAIEEDKKASRLETPAPTLEVPGAPPLRTPDDKFL